MQSNSKSKKHKSRYMKCVPIHPKRMSNQSKLTSTLYTNISSNADSHFMALVNKHLHQNSDKFIYEISHAGNRA
jgi:hypothetical protein